MSIGTWGPLAVWFGGCGLWYALARPSRRTVRCDGCGRRVRPSEVAFGSGGRDEVLCERCSQGGAA
jgi:hypothetical protein